MESIFSAMEAQFAGFGFGDLKFMVVDTIPKKEIVVVTPETEVEFNPQAIELKEEEGLSLGINYEDIGGLGDEIKKVREMIELPLKHPEIFEKLGIEPPKGVLLHGPPGTGKTLLAKAVASETNSHFILINGPEVMSKFYGESEANLRKKFEEAEQNAPSIIFFDEIDAIATKREETRGDVEKRVVAQLLGLMDGMKSRGKVIVIAATNMPQVLDSALRRPGRFDREIEIGVPGKEGRLEILKIHTRNMPLSKNVVLKEIARVTHGFVGADLNALAKEAAMIVLRRVLPDLKKEGIEVRELQETEGEEESEAMEEDPETETKKSSTKGGAASGGKKPAKVSIQRYKGLGEMNPEELWETTMDPARRILKKVMVEDVQEADKVFDILMGEDVPARKSFIQSNATKATLDI